MPPVRHPSATPTCATARFVHDEEGGVLVLWALFLAVAFGFLALSFDIGRVASTQSELQSYADQVALAAAGELDRRADAITRANAAAAGLITDRQTYADGANALGGAGSYTLTYLSALPTDDRAIATATTTDPARARYVRVQVNQRTVQTPFAAITAALTGSATPNTQSTVGATATAGMTSYACDITPLMFCAPSGWRASANVGQQLLLRSGGGNSWFPGNFGFMDVTAIATDPTGPCNGLTGANLYECLVGAERGITQCIRTDTFVLETQPGQRNGLAQAFNMRFDIYQGNSNRLRGNASYRPAANTVQGTRPGGNGCRSNNPPLSNALPLSRDSDINPASQNPTRFGNRTYSWSNYINTNHGGTYPAGTNSTSTRYQMYLAEIAGARARSAPNNVPLPGRNETGAPSCSTAGASPDLERRTIIAAAVDCTGISGGRATVTPLEYVRIFLTEPVGVQGNEANIFGEVVGSAGGVGSGATTGAFNDFIQLYR